MIGRLLLALVLLGISVIAIAVGGWMAGWIRYPVVETALTHRLNNLVPGYQFSFDQAHLDLSGLEWRKLDSTIFDEPLGLSVDRVKIIDEQGIEIADIDNLRAAIEVDFVPGLVFRIIGLELGSVAAILPSDKIQELNRIFTSPLPGGSLEVFLPPSSSQEAAKSDISYQQAHQFIRELVESSLVAFTQNLALLPDGLTSLQQLVVKQATIHRIEDEKILPVAQNFSFELVSDFSGSIDVKSQAQVMVPELSDQPVPLSFSLMIKDQPQEKTRAGTLSLLIESSPIVHNLYQLGQSLPGLNPSLESWREKFLSSDFMQANIDQDLSLTARFTSDLSTKAYEIQDINLRLDSRGSESSPGPLMSVALKSQSSEEFEGHLVFSHMVLAEFSDQIKTELPMLPLDESSLQGQMKGRLSYYSKAAGGAREHLSITLEALGDEPLVVEHPDYKLTFFNPAINFDLPLAPGETMNQAFDFTSENIRIDSPAHFSKPLDLYGLNAKARFEETGLSLQAFDVRLDPSASEAARLKGQATFTRSDQETSIQLSARVTNYPVPMLADHWPKTLNPPTRSWVTRNVTAGHVSDAQVELSGTYADGKFTPDTLEGSIALVDGTVDYLSSMPPAQVETVQINFDPSAFKIAIQQAEIDTDIQVQNGTVEISELDQERPRIDITLPFNGSLARTLDILKGPATQFSDQLSLTDATVSGEINGFIGGVLKTGFELSQDVQADEVTVQATGQIMDLSWQRQALRLDSGMTLPAGKLTSNILDFNMTREAYDIKGNVEFLFDETGLSPEVQDKKFLQADIVWQQTGSDDDQPARDLQLVLSTSAKQLDYLGLPVTNIAQGPIDLTLSYQEWQQRTQIISTIDLTDSELTLEGVSWSKDRAVPARLYMRIEPDLSSRQFMVEDFSYRDDQATRIAGTLALAHDENQEGYQIQSALLGPMQFKGADLDRVTYQAIEDKHLVEIKGKTLDLEQILPGDDLSGDGKEDGNLPQSPVEFTLNLDQLTLESGTNLSGVEASLIHKTHQGTGYIERLALTSSRGGDQLLSVTLSPLDQANAPPGAAVFSAKGPTASLLLESIGLGGQIEGGAFQIEGTRERSGQPFKGVVMIEEFTLRDAPVMSKLLQVASLTGILSALTESGLSFIEMRADYSYDQGRLALENLIAPGISVGLTARGWLDLPDKNIELQGLIVPAYFANQILNLIPVLGTLLTGGDGGGLLAASYQANGNLYDPDISANPATLLAPGIIREIFRGTTLPDQ